MKKTRQGRMPLRILIYCLGLMVVSLGIVLCKKSALGISPISTVPYALEQALPLTKVGKLDYRKLEALAEEDN